MTQAGICWYGWMLNVDDEFDGECGTGMLMYWHVDAVSEIMDSSFFAVCGLQS